eukprot:TRINITY_DN4755_c0_g2_i1.p1 TRINITY_DN4755_c0_g2~~TRINITY_DN4755_c0_g2_i1.p1  ORF type:complete len:319 (+),score=31.12 TRINITY_DN4755_c0_g2_i1:635-1591(+)
MYMKLYIFVGFLLNNVFSLQQGYEDDDSCEDLLPSCLFIAGVGLSGSTTLMDILNQHPQIHIRGENFGMFNQILEIILEKVEWSLDYELTLKYKDFAKLGRSFTISQDRAYYGVTQMFKQLFGHGNDTNKLVGFKEIRFRNELQLDFARGLCKQSKVIFQYHSDLTTVTSKAWYQWNPKAHQEIVQQIGNFHVYHQKYPNDTFISTIGDFRKPDYLKNLFDFLGLSLEGVHIDTGRLFRIDEKLKLEKKQEQKNNNDNINNVKDVQHMENQVNVEDDSQTPTYYAKQKQKQETQSQLKSRMEMLAQLHQQNLKHERGN